MVVDVFKVLSNLLIRMTLSEQYRQGWPDISHEKSEAELVENQRNDYVVLLILVGHCKDSGLSRS